MKKYEKIISNVTGWGGMILIQSSTLPVTYNILNGTATHIPPMSMILLVWGGLILYLIRAVIQRDIVHITSNTIGFFTQSALMALVVFK
jgi:hypothetical protein